MAKKKKKKNRDRQHSAADVVRALLIEVGAGNDLEEPGDWPFFLAKIPGKIRENVMGIYDSEGISEGKATDPVDDESETIDHPGIQIRIKSKNYRDLQKMILRINAEFDKTNNRIVDLDGSKYLVEAITKRGTAHSLGPDEEERFDFSINATVTYSVA